MRQGLTIVPAGLVLVVALLGAGGGSESPAANGGGWLDDRFGQRVAPLCLLLRPDVGNDLQLNQRQIAGARALFGQLIERLLKVKNRSDDAAKTERWEIDESMAAWLRHELSEVQLERLTQISLQWEGASALRRQSVAEYLSLDRPQKLRIDQLLADRDRARAAGRLSPVEFDRLSREALAVLTPPQKQQWDEALGPPCRFAIALPASPPKDPATVRTSGAGVGGRSTGR
jgi:hypothetical protein